MEVFKSLSEPGIWNAVLGDGVKIGLSLLALEQAGSMESFKSVSEPGWPAVPGDGVAIVLLQAVFME
jgi:hypothetical protein